MLVCTRAPGFFLTPRLWSFRVLRSCIHFVPDMRSAPYFKRLTSANNMQRKDKIVNLWRLGEEGVDDRLDEGAIGLTFKVFHERTHELVGT